MSLMQAINFIRCRSELIINMNSLNVLKNTFVRQNNKDLLELEYYEDDKGIYSVAYDLFHDKTEYTKHKIVKLKLSENKTIKIKLSSDISMVDMNNISIEINGIDLDKISGGIISESKLVKIKDLTYLC